MKHLILILSIAVFAQRIEAQATVQSSTVTKTLNSSETIIPVASTSGAAVGYYAVVDREPMTITKISGLSLTVKRGTSGLTPHAINADVWYGNTSWFGITDPYGGCTSANLPALPLVVPSTGHIFDCTSGEWVQRGTGGGGGAATPVPVTYSATPVFPCAASGAATIFSITLTGNVTSSTWSGCATGQQVTRRVTQDATGGRTFVNPTNTLGAGSISGNAGDITSQSFEYDGTNMIASGAASVSSTKRTCIQFFEDAANGNNYIEACGESDLAANMQLPLKALATVPVAGSTYQCVPWCNSFVSENNTMATQAGGAIRGQTFVAALPTIAKIKFRVSASTSAAAHPSVAIYDYACTTLIASATATTAGASEVLTWTIAATLSPGTPYRIFTTAETGKSVYADQGSDATAQSNWWINLQNDGTPKLFSMANAVTGTTTLTWPATCGTLTASTNQPVGLLLLP